MYCVRGQKKKKSCPLQVDGGRLAGSSQEGSKSSSEDCNLKNVLAELSHHLSKFNKSKDSSRLCKTERSKDRARFTGFMCHSGAGRKL